MSENEKIEKTGAHLEAAQAPAKPAKACLLYTSDAADE